MLVDLGEHLGVSASSLDRLNLGWVPICEFKKGKNFQGWWCVPERDSDGQPVGISLRSQSDMKCMWPSSKHGLIYEVSEQHERGGVAYQNGPANWTRTADAGVLCPVCEKPDGCLVSCENPTDPKAVVCIRVSKGAEKALRFGHLHIRKQDGKLASASALANNGGPVLIVEGMSDVCAALDLGFDSVGRPSNLACLDMLCDLVRGRDCIIVGENDPKADGRFPGREGMIAAYQVLKKEIRNVQMLMPPEHVKDLRAWVSKYKLDRPQFEKYLVEHKEENAEELVLSDGRPLTVARAYLKANYVLANRYTLRRWAGSWWHYVGGKYRETETEALNRPIYQWSHDKLVTQTSKNGGQSLEPLLANASMVMNLTEAMSAETLINVGQIPCWVNGRSGANPRDLITFANGILDVRKFLAGEPESKYLLESTPDLFTTVVLPFAFDPTATYETWSKFLDSTIGDDHGKIQLLQEWFGYCLTTDTALQKMMYLRGISGAGKGVIVNILCKMVGEDQAVSTSFLDLTGEFGLKPLIGKTVCVIPDARTPRSADMMRGLELLLNISSGDPVQINRKFKDPLERHKLIARITIAGNDFLEVPDHAGAMLRRLNIIEFKKSFRGHEDYYLEERISQEIAGVAVWALEGLRRLRNQGRFTRPESSIGALQDWLLQSSPIASFLNECFDADPQATADRGQVYDAWEKWCTPKGMKQMGRNIFQERLRISAPHVVADQKQEGRYLRDVYRGIKFKPEAMCNLLGRP